MTNLGTRMWALILLGGLLCSCKEPEDSGTAESESTAVVQINQIPMEEGIDWNQELELLSSSEVLEAAAKKAGVSAEELDEATGVEVRVEESEVRVIGKHQDSETAEAYARSLAEAYRNARNARALAMGEAKLDEINRELLAQEEEVEKARESLLKLMDEYQIPSSGDGDTLERDRMTYEKARKALEEEDDDGVLFKKDGEE